MGGAREMGVPMCQGQVARNVTGKSKHTVLRCKINHSTPRQSADSGRKYVLHCRHFFDMTVRLVSPRRVSALQRVQFESDCASPSLL